MVVSGGDGGSDIQSLLSQLGAAGGVHQVVMGSNVTFTQAGEAGMNMSDMVAQAVQGAMAGLASARNDPKWQVPEDCPNCGARVDQATACHEDNPLCGFCHAPIPVQPYESHNMSGVAAGLGQVAAQQADPSLGGTARIIATGSPVQTQLVAVTPMPGVRNAGGQDVTGLTLNVTPPNGAPYQVLMGLHVPPEAEHLLVPGATLPGKALPAHPEAVAIDATSTALPAFRYHPDPVATGSVRSADEPCQVCGRRRGYLYDGRSSRAGTRSTGSTTVVMPLPSSVEQVARTLHPIQT